VSSCWGWECLNAASDSCPSHGVTGGRGGGEGDAAGGEEAAGSSECGKKEKKEKKETGVGEGETLDFNLLEVLSLLALLLSLLALRLQTCKY
jgi:hypothetical protein